LGVGLGLLPDFRRPVLGREWTIAFLLGFDDFDLDPGKLVLLVGADD